MMLLEISAAKRINALRIVPHDHQVSMAGGQQIDHIRLNDVGILIFIHQHMLKPLESVCKTSGCSLKQPAAVSQEIIKIHHAEVFLFLFIEAGDLMNFLTQMQEKTDILRQRPLPAYFAYSAPG